MEKQWILNIIVFIMNKNLNSSFICIKLFRIHTIYSWFLTFLSLHWDGYFYFPFPGFWKCINSVEYISDNTGIVETNFI